MPRIALILSGCGVYDGSEIHEAVSCLIHLSRLGAQVSIFAPDIQAPAVNHLTGQPEPGPPRSVLAESARIARGKIAPLAALDPGRFAAAVFPGGFGAAKNLCDFASAGPACTVHPEVEGTITAFHRAGKPIGLCCIAPVLAARVLGTARGGPGVSVTIGNDTGAADAIAAMGSTNIERPVTQTCTDSANNLITAPAYMYGDAPVHEVYEGIGRMIEGVLERVSAGAR